jgi:fructokinase
MKRHALELLIVTAGSKGAFALDGAAEILEVKPAARVPVVDTVGAGDAFASVCILGLLRQWPLPQILERAQGPLE